MTGAEGHARTASDEQTHFAVRVYRALRPREGYAVVALAVVAVVCLPLAALAGGMIAGLGATPGLAVAALLMAWWLAHRRIRGIFAAALLALGGVLAVFGWGVHVLRPWPAILQGSRWLAWWLGQQTALRRRSLRRLRQRWMLSPRKARPSRGSASGWDGGLRALSPAKACPTTWYWWPLSVC